MNLEIIASLLGAGGLGAAIVGGWFMRNKTSAEATKINAEAKKITSDAKLDAELSMAKFTKEIAEDLRRQLESQRVFYEGRIDKLEQTLKAREDANNKKIKELSQKISHLETQLKKHEQ